VAGSARKKARKQAEDERKKARKEDEGNALRAIAGALAGESQPRQPRVLSAAENDVVFAQKRLIEAQRRDTEIQSLKRMSEFVPFTPTRQTGLSAMFDAMIAAAARR
jgi:hypothetical protein